MVNRGSRSSSIYLTCQCGEQLDHPEGDAPGQRLEIVCVECGLIWEIHITERGWVKNLRGPARDPS